MTASLHHLGPCISGNGNVVSLAQAKAERDERDAFAAACRQVDEACADIVRIAERRTAKAINEMLPSDTERAG